MYIKNKIQMSFLIFHDSSKLECQKTGYFNKYCKSILYTPQDDDYIPAWNFIEDDEIDTVYLETLNTKDLSNGTITADTSEDISTGGYTTGHANSRVFAAKQTETISGLHRLRITFTSPSRTWYSEIFKQIN